MNTENLNQHVAIMSGMPAASAQFVSRLRLSPHDKIVIAGVEYVTASRGSTRKVNPDGHLLRRVDAADLCESFTHSDLQAHVDKGTLQVMHDFYSPSKAKIRLETPSADLSDMPEDRLTGFLARQDCCLAFLALEEAGQASRSDASMRPFIVDWHGEYVKTEFARQTADGRCGTKAVIKAPPSPTTLRKWLRRFEACGFDPMGLCDNYGRSGNRDSRLSPEVQALVEKHAKDFMSNLKPSVSELLKNTEDAIKVANAEILNENAGLPISERRPLLKTPGRSTLERAIKRLDPFEVIAAREGVEAAKRKLYIVRAHAAATRPLERVEMDETRIPLHTFMKTYGLWEALPEHIQLEVTHKRFWLSTAIDAYSRVFLAARIIDAPSTDSACTTLSMVVSDKRKIANWAGCETAWYHFGTPELLVTDSGRNFRSQRFRAAALDLGTTVMIAPAGTPQARARKERSYGTIHNAFFSKIPGRTFENVLEKGDYDAEGNIVLSIEELAKLLVRYIVDIYHNTPHAGLGGNTPNNVWNEGVNNYGHRAGPADEVSRHVFGLTVDRTLSSRGIRVLGLYYQSKELQNQRKKPGMREPLVRVDANNLGSVSVRTPTGWISVDCEDKGFDGVNMDAWIKTQKVLRLNNADIARISSDTVSRARRETQEAIDNATNRAEIVAPIMTAEQFEKLDRDLFRGFDMVRAKGGQGDILADDLAAEDGFAVLPSEVSTPADEATSDLDADDTNAPSDDVPTKGYDDSDWFTE